MMGYVQTTQFRLMFLGAILALSASALAACAPPSTTARSNTASAAAAQEAATEVRIVATEWKFEAADLHLPVGKPVTLVLENQGLIEHDIHIADLGVHIHAQPGQTAKATFTIDQPGTYSMICSLPGHEAAGMVGQIVAGDAAAQPATAKAEPTAPAKQAIVAAPANLERLPLPEVAAPVHRTTPAVVPVEIETVELTAQLDDGVAYTFWTFGGTVPGPMVRVRQGDTVELTIKNSPDSKITHSIDLHAVTGPGGGATVTQVPPGETATFRFQALNPGVYVYHCATPMVAHHIANGMYGLIVVEPPEGLPAVDREFYVMQGDFYLQGERGQKGKRDFDMEKLLDERPDYVLFNGSVGALSGERALKARVGETVRIFFGNGGPNLTSSFHVIGEILDRVYPEGASEAMTNVQTTLVPAGGATMAEFTAEVPGRYMLVDHSLTRLQKGGAAYLEVEGPDQPQLFEAVVTPPGSAAASGH